jgi:alpha-tubulin suppressor-like RCC1 family protein
MVAGNHHTIALTENNELYAWGDGRYGQCGQGEYESTAIPHLINMPL